MDPARDDRRDRAGRRPGGSLYRAGLVAEPGAILDLSADTYSLPQTSRSYQLTGARPGTLDIFVERHTPGGSSIASNAQDVGTGGGAIVDLTFPGAPVATERVSMASNYGDLIDVWGPAVDTIDLEPLCADSQAPLRDMLAVFPVAARTVSCLF